VPELGQLAEPPAPATLRQAAERWKASRVDVSAATATYHRSALNRAARFLDRQVDSITASDIAELVEQLVAAGKARETIRKTVTVLSMVFDHAEIVPNPARDRLPGEAAARGPPGDIPADPRARAGGLPASRLELPAATRCARRDRHARRRSTAIARACIAGGVPVFSRGV
jgi:hypothetical protein